MSNLKLVITLKKTLMKHIQNNLKFIGNPNQPGFLKSQKKIRKPKASRLLPNLCDFQ
jgi:hypothetical protein